MTHFSFPFFACFLTFVIWFAVKRSKNQKIEKKRDEEFWQKEHDANFTRRKNLDVIEYISIPYDAFPIGKYADDEKIKSAEDELLSLKEQRILNLTGKTSTELKLEYGVANLATVSEYDDNYTKMIKTLQAYAEALCSLNHISEATTVLEFSISTGSDISASYLLLGDIYKSQGRDSEISGLIEQAKALDSLMKQSIIDALEAL